MTDEKRKQDDETQNDAQEGVLDRPPEDDSRPQDEDADQAGQLPPEQDREQFQTQIDAALEYVKDNKYAYGPRFSRKDLDWTVADVAAVGAGVVRVTIEYAPTSSFRGAAGSEYLDVSDSGAVMARRQIRVPKEAKPWVLISLATISVLAAAALVPFILIRSDAVDQLYVQGRTLWMRAERPVIQDAVYYQGLDTAQQQRLWAITPIDTGAEIAVVEVTVINATSGSVQLIVDGDAAEVRLRDASEPVKPIQVIERSVSTDSYRKDLEYSGFLPIWGSLTINEGEQIHGHMAFEVPEGSTIREFRWRAADAMTVRY